VAEIDLDRDLIARCAAGDADALGLLYDRYGRVVFGVLHALLPSPEAAEEVVQDAFHSVWRRARDYDAAKGSVRTWLLAIARNAAIDWRRTRGKRSERERPLEEVSERADPAADDLVERAVGAEPVRDARRGRRAGGRPRDARAYRPARASRLVARVAARCAGPLVRGRGRLCGARCRVRPTARRAARATRRIRTRPDAGRGGRAHRGADDKDERARRAGGA